MRRALCAGLMAAGISFVTAGGTAALGLRLNMTPSVPTGLWRVWPAAGALQRGGVVQACLPEHISAEGRKRGYLHGGKCPGKAYPVLKPVGALPGDVVKVTPAAVLVNGRDVVPRGLT